MKYLVLLVMLTSCTFKPNDNNIKPIPVTGDIVELCDLACNNMAEMRCDGWDGSPGADEKMGTSDDVSCKDICVEIENSNTGIFLHPACVSVASSCKQVDDCFLVE